MPKLLPKLRSEVTVSSAEDTAKLSDAEFRKFMTDTLLDIRSKQDELLTKQDKYDERLTVLEGKITKLDKHVEQSLGEMQNSIEYSHTTITELTSRVDSLEKKLNSFNSVTNTLETTCKQNHELIINLERHSRSFNIRIAGIKEKDSDDIMKIATEIFVKGGVPPEALELAHRVGRKIEGRDRQIICKLNSRVQKSLLFKQRNKLREEGILIFDDLCHSDYEEKKRLRSVMEQAYKQGCKVLFRNGKLFINGNLYHD